MIKVVLEVSPHALNLSVLGHAGYASQGQDLLCASVSSMAQMLEIGMHLLPQQPQIKKSSGEFFLKAPNDSYTGILVLSFFESCKQLEKQYSRYIQTKKTQIGE